MVGLFYKAVPVLADEDKSGGSAIFSDRHTLVLELDLATNARLAKRCYV